MSRIAIVSQDGGILTKDPDGQNSKRLTPSGQFCTWPSWSPDGKLLAYSVYGSGNNGHSVLRIYASENEQTEQSLLYGNEHGTDAIARQTPHYSYWSPDSSRLGFIAQVLGGGLTLFLQSYGESNNPDRVIHGGPLYFSWSPDSGFVAVHAHQLHFLVNVDDPTPAQIPVMASKYMAPSWHPRQNKVAVCGEISENRQALLVADAEQGNSEIVGEFEGLIGFSWNPDGETIGIARDLSQDTGYYAGIWSLDVSDGNQRQIVSDPVLSFFWSPDGSKLAYITPSIGGNGSIRWGILSTKTGSLVYLPDFRPGQEQLTMFMFFDQYGQSHSLWSPDSESLVFSGVLGFQQQRSQLPPSSATKVYVSNARREAEPVQIANGSLGIWSPI